eukprot:6188978-Pleurochrysis_carterae.AAC.2
MARISSSRSYPSTLPLSRALPFRSFLPVFALLPVALSSRQVPPAARSSIAPPKNWLVFSLSTDEEWRMEKQ